MNVLFVYSVFMLRKKERPFEDFGLIQPGISYISACLKQKGHATDLVVLNSAHPKNSESVLDSAISAFKPDLLGFSSVFSEYDFVSAVARRVKRQYPGIFLLIGGPHVSLYPRETIALPAVLDSFDALCIGEGEYPTLELVEQLEAGKKPSGIMNLWFRRDGEEAEKNPPRPFLQDLDSLPIPDREMWARWTAENPLERLSLVAGRGCPFECTYCCNHALKKITSGKYVRLRSTENIIEEIIHCKIAYPKLKEIYLEIETITIDLEWTRRLCKRLAEIEEERRLGIKFGVNFRVTPQSGASELFALLKGAKFHYVNIGLESGSMRVRKNVLNRNYSNDDVCETVRAARASGLEVVFYNLIGVPGETWEDFLETVKVNRQCLPERTWTSIFYPYPGTRLHALCVEQKLIDHAVSGAMERRMSVLDMPGFSKKQIEKAYIWFDYLIYKGHSPFFMLALRCLRKWLNLKYYAFMARRPR